MRSSTRSNNDPGEESDPHAEKRTESRPRKESRKSIKLCEYDGTTPWPIFHRLFENCSRYNCWDEAERIIHLQVALQGSAQQVLWTDGREEWSSEDLLAELSKRFSPESRIDQYRAALFARKRHRGETIDSLGSDIARLAAQAFPGPKDGTKELLTIDAFIRAIGNNDMSFHMKRTASVKTLADAVCYAQQYEVAYASLDQDEPIYLESRKDKKDSRIKVAASRDDKDEKPSEDDDKFEKVLQRLDKMEVAQQAREEVVDKRISGLARSKTQQYSRDSGNNNRGGNNYRGRGTGSHRNDDRFRGSLTKKCYNCDRPGHFAKDCFRPKRDQDSRESQETTQSRPEKDASATQEDTKAKAAAVGAPSGYWTRPSMLEVMMNGATRLCLIDTGCGTTMVPPDCVRGRRLKKTSREFTNASNDKMNVLGTANLNIRLDDRPMDIEAVVSPDCDEPMLGSDWLEKYQVTIIPHEGVVSIGGVKYQLLSRNRDQSVCRVIAEETRIIPPRSAVICGSSLRICNINERTPRPSLESWMAEPTQVQKGVFVGRTLFPQSDQDLPVSLMNITDTPVTIEKGTTLTEAVPVNTPAKLPDEEIEIADLVPRRKRRSYKYLEPLLEGLSRDVTRLERDQLWELLKSFADVFSSGKYDMGRTNLVSHKIETGEALPVKQRLRKQAWAHQEIIQEERQELSKSDLIAEYNGPWCSNVVIVTKKDGTARFCIDYRKLNEITKKDVYPLPSIEVCLDALAGARYFSTFDLRSGYHQIPMDADSIEKTAFVTREGTFAFKVMPFGLCNAGATFQRLMDLLMAGVAYKICLVYLDDIIVFSRDLKQHLERCKIVFRRLREAGLKLKVSKCNMIRDQVQFLGHIVSREGIATDPEKIEKVENWPQPRNLHDVKAFYGLCSYYRKFVKDFAKIAAPMTKLMKPENKFEWSQECEESFNELKQRLISSPILALPRQEGRFVLDTDASNFAIGGVLSQIQDGQERVIAYGSRSLTKEEKNYCVTRRELLAVTEFLRKYRQYILGRKFTIRTDHSALTWMRKTPEPIGQQARWVSLVDEFNFDIEYRAGKMHGNADALSRMPCPEDCSQCVGKKSNNRVATIREYPAAKVTTVMNYADEAVATATGEDISLQHVKSWLQNKAKPEWESIRGHNSEVKTLVKMWDSLSLRNGIIFRAWTNDAGTVEFYQKILPFSYRRDFVRLVHSGMTGGHLGEKKTRRGVQQRAYWIGWKETVHQVVQECEECQRYHRGKVAKQGEMKEMTMGAPWERVGVDITGPFPKSARGNKYMITLVDHFTKWAEAVPVPNHEATTVSRVLLEQVITRFGVPLQILTDRGSEFESKLFQELCRALGVEKIRTTAYKPSTNGMVERLHRCLNSMIGKVVDFHQKYWDEQVPIVMAAYRASRHESTGYTPNYLMFGRELAMPVDIISGVPEELRDRYSSENEYVANLQQKMRSIYEKARLTLGKAAERSRKYYNIGVKSNEYQIGEWVLYYLPKATQGRSIKFEKLFTGPFLIVKKYSDVLYGIQSSKKAQVKTVHIDKLKRWYGETPKNWIEIESRTPEELNLQLFDTPQVNEDLASTMMMNRVPRVILERIDQVPKESVKIKQSTPEIITQRSVAAPLVALSSSLENDRIIDDSRESLQQAATGAEVTREQSRELSSDRVATREGLVSTVANLTPERDKANSSAYRPPATRLSSTVGRRMKVPSPLQVAKAKPRLSRGEPTARLRDMHLYKVARVEEKSFHISTTIESTQREISMAKVKQTKRKTEEEEKQAGLEPAVAEGGGSKVESANIACPFQGCSSDKLYRRVYTLNEHAKVQHGGKYEQLTDGRLVFTLASPEIAATWMSKYEEKKLKDVKYKQNRKGATPPESRTVKKSKSSAIASTSSSATAVDNSDSVSKVTANVSQVEETSDEEPSVSTTPVATTSMIENISEDESAVPTAVIAIVATETDLLAAAIQESEVAVANLQAAISVSDGEPVASTSRSREILDEQLQVPPKPYRVAEKNLNDKTVAEVVDELRGIGATSAVATPTVGEAPETSQTPTRIGTANSDERKQLQFLSKLPTRPTLFKRKGSMTSMNAVAKRPTMSVANPHVQQIQPATANFHDRVMEAGKWLIGYVNTWSSEDRTRDLVNYLKIDAREAKNIISAFTDVFRAFADRITRIQGLDENKLSTVTRSTIKPFLQIKNPVPPTVEVTSRWGSQNITSTVLEYMAQTVSELEPPFAFDDAMEAINAIFTGVSMEVRMEIVQTMCSAQQMAARHIQANMGVFADLEEGQAGVHVNAEYVAMWNMPSVWFKCHLAPPTSKIIVVPPKQ